MAMALAARAWESDWADGQIVVRANSAPRDELAVEHYQVGRDPNHRDRHYNRNSRPDALLARVARIHEPPHSGNQQPQHKYREYQWLPQNG